jgi:hypothetical protein
MPGGTPKVTRFGPGTISLGATPTQIECEVTGGSITHNYGETGDTVTTLCGDSIGPTKTREADTIKLDSLLDLTTTGMYTYLQTNDLDIVPFEFTPNTAAAAAWAGDVQLQLPTDVTFDSYGEPIKGSTEWTAQPTFTFTPGT